MRWPLTSLAASLLSTCAVFASLLLAEMYGLLQQGYLPAGVVRHVSEFPFLKPLFAVSFAISMFVLLVAGRAIGTEAKTTAQRLAEYADAGGLLAAGSFASIILAQACLPGPLGTCLAQAFRNLLGWWILPVFLLTDWVLSAAIAGVFFRQTVKRV